MCIIREFEISYFLIGITCAPIFIIIMSLIKEPIRQKLNAVIIAFAGGAYYSGGFGAWEYLFGAILIFLSYKGLTEYKYIGIAWFLHACWDLPHHFYANPIDPMISFSSAVCAVFDPLIAIWFFIKAPAVFKSLK
jgi:hypothetical protein